MNYIVFDLEWNQNPDGKRHPDSRLPFEIIEIGAVKLNENMETVDYFQCLIKPQVYKWIHNTIHEVTHMNYCDLNDGESFPKAVRKFLKWCGPERLFFTWGNQDLTELQRNMKYYDLLSLLPGPIPYYDVQKLFGIFSGEGRRALEHAIDYLSLPKTRNFHRALADAYYTAQVLVSLDDSCIFGNSSLDVYQNPKIKGEEIYISGPEFEKFISREFYNRDKMMKDWEVTSTSCPKCHKPAKRRIRWFLSGGKVYYALAYCSDHGYIRGKIRVRRTEDGKCFGIKKLSLITEKEAEEIREKRENIRHKKESRRISLQEI